MQCRAGAMQTSFDALRLLGIPGTLRIRFKTNRLARTQASRPGMVKGGEAPCPCQPSAARLRPDTGIGDIAFPGKPKTLYRHTEAERCVRTASLAKSAPDSAVKHGDQCGASRAPPPSQRLRSSLSGATGTLCRHAKARHRVEHST
jgi:hypothetical protein